MKRRSFFQSLAKAAAIVALAPQLAFRVKPIKVVVPAFEAREEVNLAFWNERSRWAETYNKDYLDYLHSLKVYKA